MIFRAITGPTGVGKTSAAFELALEYELPVINADAFQVYKEIPVLSNRDPVPENLQTHFFAERSVDSPYSAGDFSREAEKFLSQKVLWVGTGLYLYSALYGLDEDRRKGTPFQGQPKTDYRIIVLDEERAQLYERLNQRVERMQEQNALAEAESIFKKYKAGQLSPDLPALKAIGLRQLLPYFEGQTSLEEAVYRWKQESRRLAKRQWTWLRKFCAPSERIRWVSSSEWGSQKRKIAEFLEI